MNNSRFKKREEQFFIWLMKGVTLCILGLFILLLFIVLYKGWGAMSWDMITEVPKGGFYMGGGGGILNAILGSLYLAVGSSFLAILIGLPVAFAMNIHWSRNQKWVTVARFLLDTLWGVPSIVYGAFGFALMSYFQIRASLLAGIITVALLIIPIITRAFDEVLRTIPKGLLEASHSLGATPTETAYVIFFRQAFPGFITAALLGLSRGIGDTASVLFTAGYTDHIPHNIMDPTATLPLAIFFQLSSPIIAVKERAFAATLILTVLILCLSIISRVASKNANNHVL